MTSSWRSLFSSHCHSIFHSWFLSYIHEKRNSKLHRWQSYLLQNTCYNVSKIFWRNVMISKFLENTSRNLNIRISPRIAYDDVIKWKHFPRYWPFVRGIHRSPVISPHKGQWRGALVFSLICARINGWVNNGDVGDLRRPRAHCDVIVTIR